MPSNFVAKGAENHEASMGRWSQRLALPFLEFAGVPPRGRRPVERQLSRYLHPEAAIPLSTPLRSLAPAGVVKLGNVVLPTPSRPCPDGPVLAEKLRKPTFGQLPIYDDRCGGSRYKPDITHPERKAAPSSPPR
jgi:hypothetical protein